MNDGSIIILGRKNEPDIEDAIRRFLNLKNNEVWVELIQKDGDKTV